MKKRPRSITVIGWLFIAAGAIGLAYHASELQISRPFDHELVWVLFLRFLAILCGAFVLRGSNWARWILLAWMAYHVILSALHSTSELVVHSVLLAIIAFLLVRPQASAYFRGE